MEPWPTPGKAGTLVQGNKVKGVSQGESDEAHAQREVGIHQTTRLHNAQREERPEAKPLACMTTLHHQHEPTAIKDRKNSKERKQTTGRA